VTINKTNQTQILSKDGVLKKKGKPRRRNRGSTNVSVNPSSITLESNSGQRCKTKNSNIDQEKGMDPTVPYSSKEDSKSLLNVACKEKLKNLNISSNNGVVSDITHKKCTGNNNWIAFLNKQNLLDTKKKSTIKDKPVVYTNIANGKVTKHLALDCEFVGIGENGKDHMLARVSIVNSHGDCVYDKFVKAREPVINYRTFVSGIRPGDMEKGEDFDKVQKDVASLLKGKILVGHSLKNDLAVLLLTHPRHAIRDTSKYFRENGKMTPSLKLLAQKYLGISIQEGEHSSIQDSQAAMQLYNMYRKQWETGGGNKKSNRIHHKKTNSTKIL
jgi:RNA exonuclease 4